MDFKWIIYTTLFAVITVKESSSKCEIRNYPISNQDCNYTVFCSVNPESVQNPSCNVNPFVTFIITSSSKPVLTTGYFATTNFDTRVRAIQATNNSWTTITESAFRYYAKIISIDLSNNGISFIKNEALRSLTLVQSINISHNNIESLYPNSLLITESRTNAVQELDLSYNQLKILNTELNELPNLQTLYLQNNKLYYLADDAFVNLKNLNHLYLQNNRIQSLNMTLTNLKKLVTLNLSNNYLMKLSGFEVNRMVALVNVNFSHNAITTVESNCFNQAFNLRQLDFSHNNIKMVIENVMFINNNGLEYLDLFNNYITGLQDNFVRHCSIIYLNLNNNNISGQITEDTFSGARHISRLDITKQNVTGIRDKAFADMVYLLHLNLSKNSIVEVGASSFINTSIIVLDMSYNKIQNLTFLKNCLSNLTELYMSNNNIQVVSKNTFASQLEIVTLDLSMNNIIRIEQYSLSLIKLQFINVSGNRLNGTIEKNVFSPARYLRFLDLSNFNICKIDDKAFVDLPILARLNLSNNQIEDIKPSNFEGVYHIYSLDMSHNKLRDLKLNDSVLMTLKALYLNNNWLSNISVIFPSKTSLIYLDLSNNNISSTKDIGVETLPNLTTLYLAHNKIKNFNNAKTNSLSNLRDLRLSYNLLDNITLRYFKELISLDISNNNLTYINSTLLENVKYLQALDIGGNKIKDLPPGTFQYMKNLRFLNLSANHLTKLRYGSLKGLHKTEVLDVSKNNITSLEVDLFHECVELNKLIIDYNRIKTFNVRGLWTTLPKLKTISLGGNPISCKEIVLNIKSANATPTDRQLEVTSVDKVYHEDNVHGIKCGDDDFNKVTNDTTKPESVKPTVDDTSGVSSLTIVLIWCTVITILIMATAMVIYIRFYKKRFIVVSDNSRNSLQLDGADFQSDLLN